MSRSNLYPTEEDLFIAYPKTLPILSTKPQDLQESIDKAKASNNDNIDQIFINSLETGDSFNDGRIIPWRKLYVQERTDESLMKSTFHSSSFAKFFIKYNQWPILILSSVAASILTIILDWSSTFLNDIKYGYCKNSIFTVRESCDETNWIVYTSNMSKFTSFLMNFVIVLIFSIILAIICLKLSGFNVWISKSGISELKMIILGYVNKDFLRSKIIFKKFLLLILVVSCSGLLLGYEGPLIHISCGLINIVIDFFSKNLKIFYNLHNEAIKREMISIGFVIGISLAFGAPIGGLLFSIETLKFGPKLINLIWSGFVCASIATFIFYTFHPFKKIIINEAFTVEIGNGWILFETLPYMFVGLVCGLLALLYNFLHFKIIDFKRNIQLYDKIPQFITKLIMNPYLEISVLVTLTQFLTYTLNFSHLTLNETMMSLLYDCDNDQTQNYFAQSMCQQENKIISLVYYFIIIFLSSNYAYSLDIPGGILLPSLTIGAVIGRIIGDLVEIIQQNSGAKIFLQCYEEKKNCVSPGSYAMVGAASFFAGVTNTSVAAVVIVFEFTGAVTYLIPLMLGVVVSKTITDIFNGKSFYDLWLIKLNKTYLTSGLVESRLLANFTDIKVGDVISDGENFNLYVEDNYLTVSEIIHKINEIFEHNPNSEIVNDGFVLLKNRFNHSIVGWINFNDLYRILKPLADENSSKLVSFLEATAENNNNNDNIISVNEFVIRKKDLFLVNKEYSLFSAYNLMDQMLITNIFLCENTENGQEFKGLLRMQDLLKLIKDI